MRSRGWWCVRGPSQPCRSPAPRRNPVATLSPEHRREPRSRTSSGEHLRGNIFGGAWLPHQHLPHARPPPRLPAWSPPRQHLLLAHPRPSGLFSSLFTLHSRSSTRLYSVTSTSSEAIVNCSVIRLRLQIGDLVFGAYLVCAKNSIFILFTNRPINHTALKDTIQNTRKNTQRNVTARAGRESYRRNYPMDVLKSSLPTEQTTQNSKCADFTQTFKIDDEPALKKYVKFQR